jgi:hypothetical protein
LFRKISVEKTFYIAFFCCHDTYYYVLLGMEDITNLFEEIKMVMSNLMILG